MKKVTRREALRAGAKVAVTAMLGPVRGGTSGHAEGLAMEKTKDVTTEAGEELCFLEARSLSAMLRAKKVSAVEVMQAHLEQIRRVNAKVNAIVTLVGTGHSGPRGVAHRTRAKGVGDIGTYVALRLCGGAGIRNQRDVSVLCPRRGCLCCRRFSGGAGRISNVLGVFGFGFEFSFAVSGFFAVGPRASRGRRPVKSAGKLWKVPGIVEVGGRTSSADRKSPRRISSNSRQLESEIAELLFMDRGAWDQPMRRD